MFPCINIVTFYLCFKHILIISLSLSLSPVCLTLSLSLSLCFCLSHSQTKQLRQEAAHLDLGSALVNWRCTNK